jgi:DNA-binding MarR family transcriptional regulator
MKRSILLTELEDSIHTIGKGIHEIKTANFGYSPAQNHVLMLIGMNGGIGIKKLAETLHVTSGAATQHVASLEKADLVERNINFNDRREVKVTLTKKGGVAYKEVCLIKSKILSEIFSALDDNELQTLVNLFNKVSKTYVKDEEYSHAKV